MANYQLLKADIDKKVYQNGHQEITGENLNAVLNAMVTTLGAEYQFAGVATIDTNPGTPDAKVFYIANSKGTYTNFGSLEVTEDEVVVLYWDTAWHKEATGIASQAKLTELSEEINEVKPKETEEEGFYICNENGEVIALFKEDQWKFLNTGEIKTGTITKRGNVANGDTWNILRNSVKHGQRLVFSGKISSFLSIIIGHGTMTNGESSWIEVDDTNLYVHFHNSGDSEQSGYPKTYAHGLTIANNIQIEVVQKNAYTALVRLTSNGSVYETPTEITWFGSSGSIYMTSTSTLTDCTLGWTSSQIDTGLWLFGDSYFSLNDNSRWTTYLFQNEHTHFMLNAHPGENSATALIDLQNLLTISTPKAIVWCMGMNDADSQSAVNPTWKSVVDSIIDICKQNNIELILSTIPTVVGGWNPDTQSNNLGIHKYKNAIVKESGYRYIDFASAVGANETTGEWFNNGQENDMLEGYGQQRGRIHPTVYGAKALYAQAVADCPELVK